MGRGNGRPHATTGTESTVSIVGMDYFFVTKEGVRRRDEIAAEIGEDQAVNKARDDGQVLKCLLVRCLKTKDVFAHVTPPATLAHVAVAFHG